MKYSRIWLFLSCLMPVVLSGCRNDDSNSFENKVFISADSYEQTLRVQRDENGKKILYRVNLNSGQDLYASPVYYLQQNDVVYVEPSSMRARQATVNGNNVRSATFWMSLVSLLTTITVLFIK